MQKYGTKNIDEVKKEISLFSVCTEMTKYWNPIMWTPSLLPIEENSKSNGPIWDT